jgi:predicted nucleic acid-binding protein
MSAEVFLDTNVLVYMVDSTDVRKQVIAERIVRDALVTGNACISFQVVQEWLNTVTRKAAVSLSLPRAQATLETVLVPLYAVSASPGLYRRALDLQGRWQYGFYDSLIVAAALEAGCTRLLSEDLQHGQRIESLTIENPFRL